ncbi:hypothetical protein FHR24_000953 [Wenyingzhuangia heitensis]|uniref:YD repeat-containing protein n=1 Tax=Wenyingzhuangia heitensis TaxID=1487859 RepID=A0ABX0U847_9FLAO|nr:hypothetical protein [Wenyingzhuangia heitensis]NIJ44514.1 hypothetical protein [Wenyingzhuangia heitensis]
MKTYITIIALILISCSKSNDLNNGKCRIIFSDGIFLKKIISENSDIIFNPSTSENINYKDTTLYQTRYFYNKKNQLEKRVKYNYAAYKNSSPTYYSPNQLNYESTDSLIYDNSGRLNKLYAKNSYYIYEYLNTTKKVNIIHHYFGSNKKLYATENITYDNQNRIHTTVKTYVKQTSSISYTSSSKKEYKYLNNNLAEIRTFSTSINTEDNSETSHHTIQKFENYDSYPNPLKNLPFIDLRGISESENNYRKYTTKTISYHNNSSDTTTNSGYEFTDKSLKYLEKTKEECDY